MLLYAKGSIIKLYHCKNKKLEDTKWAIKLNFDQMMLMYNIPIQHI